MPPNHLAVYLTNRCNLSCSYCYVSVNQGPPTALSFEDFKAAADYFFSDKISAKDKKVTFLGGEPFLNFPLFDRMAGYARQAGGPDAVIQVFTNGTYLSAERLNALAEKDVHVTISLDGKKETNDALRTFVNDDKGSVFEEVAAKLKSLPKDNLGVSLVFTAKTVEKLLANIDFFYQMGFGRITFNPELYEIWPEERLEALRATLRGLRRYYKKILESGARPFVIQILFAILENLPKNKKPGPAWWHDCHNVILGPDKQFYSCDKALSFPIGEAADYRIGTAEVGLDWVKREGQYGEAIGYIEKEGFGKEEYFCPMGVYFYAKQAGKDPEEIMANFHAVADIFSGELIELVRENQASPAFKRLYVDAHIV